MNQQQRLERLDQLSGRVGEMRTVFDRISMLRDMGAMDPAIYADTAGEGEGEEEQGEAEELEAGEMEWLPWVEDARLHVESRARAELLPDGLRTQLVTTEALEEDQAVVQVPLHNCLVLYMAEDIEDARGLNGDEALEREEAERDFMQMQLMQLQRWCEFHGPVPRGLVDLLCDFSPRAPNARTKMALWLLWCTEWSPSPYWQEVAAALPQPEVMPNLEFCTDAELFELQWVPYAIPAMLRRETLRTFYQGFCHSGLAEDLGWVPLEPRWDRELIDVADAERAAQVAKDQASKEKAGGGSGGGSGGDGGGGGSAAAASAASGGKEKRGKGGKGGKGAKEVEEQPVAEGAAEEEQPEGTPLRPLPPFERFLWAYCHAEARTVTNGERVVFIPQADPSMYAQEPLKLNCTLAVMAAESGPVLDEFAVICPLRPLEKGEPVYVRPPLGTGPADGGGGTTTQVHEQFGLVAEPGGNRLDIIDLEPENGSIMDLQLKQIAGQFEASGLDNVTDPRIRHLLSIMFEGQEPLDVNQLPPIRQIIPKLQLPKLWGPGLVAGVQRLKLEEFEDRPVNPFGGEDEDWEDDEAAALLDEALADEGEVLSPQERQQRRREAAAEWERMQWAQLHDDEINAARIAEMRGGAEPEDVEYAQLRQWQADPSMTQIVEVPADDELLTTEEGRAEFRRMLAAWASLPRQSPSTREHGRCMELAVQGAPLEQVFTTPRDIVRELAAAETVLEFFQDALGQFPTTIEYDEQLLAAASAAAKPTAPASSDIPPPRLVVTVAGEETSASSPTEASPSTSSPAPSASEPSAPSAAAAPDAEQKGSGRKGGRGRGKKGAGGGSGSDSDSGEAPAPASAPAASPASEGPSAADPDEIPPEAIQYKPLTVINTLRMRGLVAWRWEFKRVWAQMVGMVEEYRDSLKAVVEAGGLAELVAAEEAVGSGGEEGTEAGSGAAAAASTSA